MDTIPWPLQDEIGLVNPSSLINSIAGAPSSSPSSSLAAAAASRQVAERKARPQKEKALHCPRCNSTNTKFCYYNNYSLTQPRYFCKTCRRYWTEGGSLRNVPVGGGSRKNKRPSSSSSSSSCIGPLLQPLKDHAQNPRFPAGHGIQSDLYGLFGSSGAASTPAWSTGGGVLDLLTMTNPFSQVGAAGQGLGLQGLIRSSEVDSGGCDHGCMQGVMLPLPEMGRASAEDALAMDVIGGGIHGGDPAHLGAVWNW